MRDTSASCQLELFSDPDLAPAAKPSPQTSPGRLSIPVAPKRVLPVEIAAPQALPPEACGEESLTALATRLVIAIGLPSVAANLSVRWNARMRTAAGRAFYESCRIELNPALFEAAGVDARAEIDRTLRHELAHLVAFHRAGGRRIEPHGREWRQACADLDIPDEARCHTLPFEARRQVRKLAYECPACGSQILRVRRFRHAVACYECCQRHSGGRYDDRFRLRARRHPSA
jgi:SprT protein